MSSVCLSESSGWNENYQFYTLVTIFNILIDMGCKQSEESLFCCVSELKVTELPLEKTWYEGMESPSEVEFVNESSFGRPTLSSFISTNEWLYYDLQTRRWMSWRATLGATLLKSLMPHTNRPSSQQKCIQKTRVAGVQVEFSCLATLTQKVNSFSFDP